LTDWKRKNKLLFVVFNFSYGNLMAMLAVVRYVNVVVQQPCSGVVSAACMRYGQRCTFWRKLLTPKLH